MTNVEVGKVQLGSKVYLKTKKKCYVACSCIITLQIT